MKAVFQLLLFCCALLSDQQLHAKPATPYPVYTASLSTGHVAYYQIGEGAPVVLLHGLFASKEQWLTLVAHLLAHHAPYQFIIPDLPGFGQSKDFPMTIYNLSPKDHPNINQVYALHEFIKAIKLHKPFALAGNSMGGLLAEQYTEAYSEEVSSLTFMGSPEGITPFTALYYQKLAQGFNPFIPVTAAQLNEELDLLMVNAKAHVPSVQLTHQLLQANQKSYPKLAMIYTMVSTYHHLRALMDPIPQLQIPVLIFWGTEDRIFGDIKSAYLLRSRFVRSPMKQVVPLAQAGHVVMLENDQVLERIAMKYLSFLSAANEKMNIQFA